MSISFLALALGGAILTGRYIYKRIPQNIQLLNNIAGNSSNLGSSLYNRMGGRLSRSNLLGFEHKMTLSEACNILNISPTASKDKIRESYKLLMMRNHPDNGGSTYIASKVNEAKDFMLK
ncbi:bifunctional DnaJ domain/Chaperone J-domain superfamily [Babesia duncani]|uniref:Bifunctional DnaJ domain/Chaperone J-domain superfamily n=1 Tax=Babesia duncani TaxID=323732 RepID=A0AAD9UPB4_9APIC|nr:bifunctional DnaJ domain/Chaperone J-domain superfamily [Babesia duncani]